MLDHAMPVLHSLFVTVWRLFTSWYFPGTLITPAAWGFFVLAMVAGLRVLRFWFMGGGPGNFGNGGGRKK